jgi:ABC-type Mn2+/Zn2+ transport system ATPase subunit
MIRRFYVHNFRCLENFELPVSGRASSLLIGGNGSGKSTVGFALEILQSIARGTNRVGQVLKPSDFARGRSDVPIRLEIDVELGTSVHEYRLALELPHAFRELRVAEEKLSVDGKDVYSRDRSQVTLAGTAAGPRAKFLIDWHLIALPIIQARSEADPHHIFRSWLARMLILAPIPSQITGDSEGDTLMPNRAVTNFGEWFTGVLAHSPSAYAGIDRYLKGIMPDLEDIKNPVIAKESRSLTVQFQQDEASLSLPFRDLSDGEKCFFISALVLASNQAYGPILCFWDEPDNYLSLSEVGHFVMALRRSFQYGGQLLVTSHNPQAIRQFSDENTLIMHRRSHLEPTLIRPVSEVQVNGGLVDALIRNDVEP